MKLTYWYVCTPEKLNHLKQNFFIQVYAVELLIPLFPTSEGHDNACFWPGYQFRACLDLLKRLHGGNTEMTQDVS